MTYQEALDFLYSRLPMYQRLGAKAMKPDLSNTLALSKVLHHPHEQFPSVHIAGTNGKGSSAHALASILQEAGYRTGLYTSPHLKSYRERTRVNGEMIEQDYAADFVSRYRQPIEEISPSFFEMTAVMAFAYFAHEQVDIAIVEAGLGGRLDSTNIIRPLLSLITTIGRDHEDLLGNTLEAIASEKAGIIKPGIPVVVGDIAPAAMEVIELKAESCEALLSKAFDYWQVSIADDLYSFERAGGLSHRACALGVEGAYFHQNVIPVLELIGLLNKRGFSIASEQVKEGLRRIADNTGLKGRWQRLSSQPQMYCDVAHNEDGIRAVVEEIQRHDYDKLHMVLGTAADKPIDKIMRLLIQDAHYYLCAAKVPRALPVENLMAAARAQGLSAEAYASVAEAIDAAKHNASDSDFIFVGGSTFVVAEIDNL